jgi:uncharacterized protein YutD
MKISEETFNKIEKKIFYILNNFDSCHWDKSVKKEFADKILYQIENIIRDIGFHNLDL